MFRTLFHIGLTRLARTISLVLFGVLAATAIFFYEADRRHMLNDQLALEIIFHAALFVVLWWLRPRIVVKGELLKVYLLCYALFRFAVEFVRGNQIVWGGLTRSQLFLIPSALQLCLYFWRQWPRDAYRLPRREAI